MKSKETLINEFKTGFSVLVKIRIDAYHRNQISQHEFINSLITCPAEDDYHPDHLQTPMRTMNHFLANLNTEFAYFDFARIDLDQNFNLQYEMVCYPSFFEEDYEGDYIEINYRDGVVAFGAFDEYLNEFLLKMSEEKLSNLIKQIQGEISFGTLKAECA